MRFSTLAFALLLAGCGDPNTGNERVQFAVEVGGVERPEGPYTFTTDQGWAVTLSEAKVGFGPLYLNTIVPLEARRSPWERVSELFVRSAWAHGDSHLAAGRIAAQVTTQVTVDALAPALVAVPGGGDGIDLDVQSAEVWYFNRAEAPMTGTAIRVAGEATREGVTVAFRGTLVINDDIRGPQLTLDQARRVRGIPAAFRVREGGTLAVRIDARHWFDGADFGELRTTQPEGSTGPVGFTLTDNVGRAFLNNVRRSRDVFAVTFR